MASIRPSASTSKAIDIRVSLPPELEEQIVAAIGADSRTLCQCALVSRSWLHYARQEFFAHHPVEFRVWLKPDLLHRLFEASSKSTLTFCPYIREVSFHASDGLGASNSDEWEFLTKIAPNNLIQCILSQCSNINRLSLHRLTWRHLSSESVRLIHSLRRLATISFVAVGFTSEGLWRALTNLQSSVTSCYIILSTMGTTLSRSSPLLPRHPEIRRSLKLKFGVPFYMNGQSDLADFILSAPGINVVSLDLFGPRFEQRRYAELVRHCRMTLTHIMIPLGWIYTGTSQQPGPGAGTPPIISIATLPNLQVLDVGLITPLPDEFCNHVSFERSSLWLTMLLATIPSSHEAFSTLTLAVSPTYTYEYGPPIPQCDLRNFNWKRVEDQLLDMENFTSGIPTVKVNILSPREISRLIRRREEIDRANRVFMETRMEEMKRCMQRMHNVGKLQVVSGRPKQH